METVISKSNKIIGYLISGIYVDTSIMLSLVENSLVDINNKATSFCDCKKYVNKFDCSNYGVVLKSLSDLGFTLRPYIFCSCSLNDIDVEDTQMLGVVLADVTTRHLQLYLCVNTKENKQVGCLLVDKNLYKSKSLHIFVLEVFDKSKGYGTGVVSQLKALDKSLTGLSIVTATDFWKKQGAVFNNLKQFKI